MSNNSLRHFRFSYAPFLGFILLLWVGCESRQGSVNAPPGAAMGRPADEIEPAPESKSYPNQSDVFQAAEYDQRILDRYPNARQVRLRVGEVLEVFRGSAVIGDGEEEMAFYVPPEGRAIVQVITERRGLSRTYFLRGLAAGETVGGVVERDWLTSDGLRPRNAAFEGRIQIAVRGQPFLILIQ